MDELCSSWNSLWYSCRNFSSNFTRDFSGFIPVIFQIFFFKYAYKIFNELLAFVLKQEISKELWENSGIFEEILAEILKRLIGQMSDNISWRSIGRVHERNLDEMYVLEELRRTYLRKTPLRKLLMFSWPNFVGIWGLECLITKLLRDYCSKIEQFHEEDFIHLD